MRDRLAGATIVIVNPVRLDRSVLFDPAADLPNLIITPHMAWASQQSLRNIADQLIDTIESFVAGRPRNVVVESNTE